MRTILINTQWQGSADLTVYHGAMELQKRYLMGQEAAIVPVSTDETDVAEKENGIIAWKRLKQQTERAYHMLLQANPDTVLSIGGGCDADVATIVYLSRKYKGRLGVIWLDAHGDLNTPAESETSLFYGMPLRSVLDAHCFGLLENACPIKAEQVVHIGARDLDAAEEAFMERVQMRRMRVEELQKGEKPLETLLPMEADQVYIHLDLDVLDPSFFPETPLPVEHGLSGEALCSILNTLREKAVGLGIYEYKPCGREYAILKWLMEYGMTLPGCG